MGKIVQSLMGLIISMLTARYLGPSNFGLISYASSLTMFAVPISQLGINNVLVKKILDDKENEGKTLGTSLILSLISSVCCIVGIISFVSVANNGEKQTIIVCFLYSIMLITQATELIQYWFQAKFLSKHFTIISTIAYICVSVYKIYLLIANKSVYWFSITAALDYLLIAIFLFVIYKRLGGKKLCFSKTISREILHQSKHYIIPGLMIMVFSQTDKIMLKLMINDTAAGLYTTAVTCVGLTSFVFTAIIDSMRPSILSEKTKQNIENKIVLLYSIITALSIGQAIVMTFGAELIIKILYGKDFLDSAEALKIVSWYTGFSYYGAIRNIWILANNKQSCLWIINLSGAFSNVILNLILIPVLGIEGAAIATLATQIFTNVIMGYIVKPISYNNNLLMKSFNVKYLVSNFLKKT